MPNDIIQRLKGGLIVSCQAEYDKGSQLFNPLDIARMAKEVLMAGACAVRVCGVDNLVSTRCCWYNFPHPVIAITKSKYPDGRVLITPDMDAIDSLAAERASIIGLDMTKRLRLDGTSSYDLLRQARARHPDTLFMADIADAEEAAMAIEAGADLVGTTLSGYTPDTESKLVPDPWYDYAPDEALVAHLVRAHPGTPIIAEGRWRTPEQCRRAVRVHGAWAVCVGSQVTRPREITRWHVNALTK